MGRVDKNVDFVTKIFGNRTQPRLTAQQYSAQNNSLIQIDDDVVRHVSQYTQKKLGQLEAGGQLFGHVCDGELYVCKATGPYKNDQRGRRHYFSCPSAAQKAITTNAKKGFLYVGEWHTHPEPRPQPSHMDRKAMQRIWSDSALNTNQLLLLIVGNAAIHHWHIETVMQDTVFNWIVYFETDNMR